MDQSEPKNNKEMTYQKVIKEMKPLTPLLQILDISNLKLTNLSAIKNQVNLQILVAEQNALTNDCFKELEQCNKLQILSLQDNLIKDHRNMECMSGLPLIELRLLFNEVAQLPQYYKRIYQLLPKLYTLDDFDRDGLQINDLFAGNNNIK